MPRRQDPSLPPGVGRNRRNIQAQLWFFMLATNIVGIFAALMIARSVRGWSLDPERESIYVGVYYALMFVTALADAFWADELFFKGGFRKTYLSGRGAAYSARKGDMEGVAASLKPMHTIFPLLVIAGWGASYGLYHVMTRGFMTDYDRIGKHARIIRSSHPSDQKERLNAIDALSMIQRPQVQAFLSRQLQHPDERTAAWAAWAMGRIRDTNMRRLLADELMAAARSDRPQLAREAGLALARMQHRAIAPLLEKALEKELSKESIDRRLVWAMAFTQRPQALPLLQKALYRPDLEGQRLAAWAIAQQSTRKNATKAYEALRERLLSGSIETRCAVVHALGILGHEAANLDLVDAWKRSTAEERQTHCLPEKLPLRPDGQGDDIQVTLITPIKNTIETFEVLTLFSMGAIRATEPEIRRPVEQWLEGILDDEGAPPRTRDAARSLLDGIRQAGPLPDAPPVPKPAPDDPAAAASDKTPPADTQPDPAASPEGAGSPKSDPE